MHEALPAMGTSSYAASSYAGGDLSHATVQSAQNMLGDFYNQQTATDQIRRVEAAIQSQQQKVTTMAAPARRVVQIFIADTNENIPLTDCLLYQSVEKLTDATDQELFYELDIKGLLEQHNQKRIKVVDKKVKDRTEYLEAAKVRDLKMVVVTVANL